MSYTSMASANWLRLGQLLRSSLVESLAAASPKQADNNLVYTIFDPPKNLFYSGSSYIITKLRHIQLMSST